MEVKEHEQDMGQNMSEPRSDNNWNNTRIVINPQTPTNKKDNVKTE